MTVLIVGATGQLGAATLNKLLQRGVSVRAFVRRKSDLANLKGQVELCVGNLGDQDSLDRACVGAEVVIATASSIIPRRGDSFARVEDVGYRNLIAACERHGVGQFVYMSVTTTPWDRHVPTFRTKRLIEGRVSASSVPCTIFRSALFMDIYLATIGSNLPFYGAARATLQRPFWFTRLGTAALGQSIERLGLAFVPGNGKARHAFIAIDDVATFLAESVGDSRALGAVFDIGGPDTLAWDDVVQVYARVLGRPVRTIHLPGGLLRSLQHVMTPLSPSAANLLGVLWINGMSAGEQTDTRPAADLFGVSPTSVEDFLRHKLSLRTTPPS
jgi:uncharacterized protein YbjT (DUF2867 family)